jgi:Trypsin-co-occurring domain 2
MEKIGLVETIDALRSELAAAVEKAQGQEIQFPIGSVQLEFQVGVTWDTEAKAGVRFWVLELGASGSYANESVQKVTLNLQAPVDAEGNVVKVTRHLQQKP